MVAEELIGISKDVIAQIGHIALLMQALGVIVVLWIIFQIISLILNRKRMKEIYHIKQDMQRIERKIDSIIARRQQKA